MSQPIPLPISVAVEATPVIAPGGTVTCTASLTIDVDALARGLHEQRVLPGIEGYGLSEEFAARAWTKLVASDIRVRLPLPAGVIGAKVTGTDAGKKDQGVRRGRRRHGGDRA